MIAGNGNGGLKLVGGGLTQSEAQAKADAEMARAVELIARKAAADQVVLVVEHYFTQLPELIAGITVKCIAQAFLANGLDFKPPNDSAPSVGNAAAEKPARHGGDPQAEDSSE